eukprot:3371768-Rhodomonas_salina.1
MAACSLAVAKSRPPSGSLAQHAALQPELQLELARGYASITATQRWQEQNTIFYCHQSHRDGRNMAPLSSADRDNVRARGNP